MELLRMLRKNDIAVEQAKRQQPKGSNSFEVIRRLFSYSLFIILIGILLIGGLWLVIRQQINYDYDRTILEASMETMNLTRTFEEHVRRVITGGDKDLLNIKQTYEREGILSPIFVSYAETAAKDPTRESIAVLDEQGVVTKSLIIDKLGVDLSDREYFQFHRIADSNAMYIGNPIVTRSVPQWIIPLTRRINKSDGSFGGIVYIGLKVDYFLGFYQRIDLGPDQLIALNRADGLNLTRQAGPQMDSGSDIRGSTLWQKVLAGLQYGTHTTNSLVDRINRVVSFRVMPDYPLIISVGQSTQVALAGFTQRKQEHIFWGLLISVLILILCGLQINRNKKTKSLMVSVQQERDRLFALINSISDEVWFTDTEKRIKLANSSALQAYHISSSETGITELAAGLEVLRPDGTQRPIEEAPPLRSLQGEVVRNQLEIVRFQTNGEWRYREVNSNPVTNDSGNIIGVVSIVRDITERKNMENELKNHRDNLQKLVEEQVRKIYEINTEMTAIFESISEPFFVLDKEWQLAYINKEAAQADDKLSAMHIGQNIWEVFHELVGGELYQKSHEACATNTSIHTLVKSTIGEKWFDVNLYPYANGLIVYCRDVTEQKKYEEDLLRLDRLNLIGEMAASIGHEVRNPMTTVRGYLQRFSLKTSFTEYREQFALMIEELDRANAIITEFLSLAKNKKVNLTLINLNIVIKSIFPLLQSDALRRGNNIELMLGAIPEVFADEKEIRQCILNLVGNGLDAMPEGGNVTIATTQVGNQVVMTVRDSGQGIPPEVKAKLGTPFMTTKEHGTGLGLPVCYRIAQRHQAAIEVETGPEGTAFHIIFNKMKLAV